MKDVLQHLVSLVLPVTVLIIVPALIQPHWVAAAGLQLVGGMLLLLLGLIVMAGTIASFARIGGGTLAPWSPPRHLVVQGAYAHVRNPMIVGVILTLLGEALSFSSWPIFIWAVLAFLINTIYFILSEEPGLERRFGEAYCEYKRNVPRWLPRRTPWRPEKSSH